MKFRRPFSVFISVVLLGILAGCATAYSDGTNALQASNYTLAESLLVKALEEGDNVPGAWNNLGVVYMRTNRMDLAVRCYTMAARHGDTVGQANLVRLNRPVPTADLVNAQKGTTGSEAVLQILNAGVQGYNQGKATPVGQQSPSQLTLDPPKLKCESKRTATGTIDTECKQQ